MNNDTLEGSTRDIAGRVKETTGTLTGNDRLRGEGVADQVGGNTQKAVGSLRDAVAPITNQAKELYRTRPMATLALAGVVGIALLNTLRGRR
ncbi:CsbD family protein [Sphingomonas sp. ID1715]|uniref:CsbD family protein n=1 Tax=Sphingomonas sp. ID1715 TaxID=1656898 RepID=UPI0014877BED|nr:CsbD family protein [Sphingomonas sp. ID1715]NNM76834.1 CsbD family protein [Sphingomonas sp. ID1715]